MANQESVNIRELAKWTVIAAVTATVVNSIIYLITEGEFDGAMIGSAEDGMTFGVGNVIFLSMVLILLGGVVLGVLSRFIARPITIWRYLAVIVLLISYPAPFVALEASSTARIILVILHTIAAGIAIYLLPSHVQETAAT